MSNIIFYKAKQVINKNSQMFPYKNSHGETDILVLDNSDFDITTTTQISLEVQSLIPEYHDEPEYEWDRLSDIDILLRNKMYKSALLLALTVPDICSKITHPDLPLEKRYPQWFNENIYGYNIGSHGKTGKNFDCVNGYFCYRLRCNLVHGEQVDIETLNNDPTSSFVNKYNYKRTFFKLTDKEYSELFIVIKDSGEKYAIILHSVKQLILSIIRTADNLYKNTKNKELFYDGCDVLLFPEYKELSL